MNLKTKTQSKAKLAAPCFTPIQARLQRERAVDLDNLSELSPIFYETLRSRGRALDPATRTYMESHFGYDFSQVRVHTDARADMLNRSLRARASTIGQYIFFRQAEYNPGTRNGRKLLAHELTHVVQQQKSLGSPMKTIINQPGDKCDREADQVAAVFAQMSENQSQLQHETELGRPIQIRPLPGQITPLIQRQASRLPEPLQERKKAALPEISEVMPMEKELDIETAEWAKLQIGLQRDFYQVMDGHAHAASLGSRKAINKIFNGIDELAQLETLKWETFVSPVRMIPLPLVGGYIGKQIDTIIKIEIGMEKRTIIKNLKNRLQDSIEEKLVTMLKVVLGGEYRELEKNALADARGEWITVRQATGWKIDDPRLEIELRDFLLEKYGIKDVSKAAERWEEWLRLTYGPRFWQLFKDNGLVD